MITTFGCYNFYTEVQPRRSIVHDNYYNVDTSFILSDYHICWFNGRYERTEVLSREQEDSILTLFNLSASKNGINITFAKTQTIIASSFCDYSLSWSTSDLIDTLEFYIDNDKMKIEDNKNYIVPYISIKDYAQNTSFNTGNVYINKFGVAIGVIIIKDIKIVYSKFYSGDGVSDNKEKVTNDWPNYPSPPDVLYEQAHWDTLVGLAMRDYMKRLNVDKK